MPLDPISLRQRFPQAPAWERGLLGLAEQALGLPRLSRVYAGAGGRGLSPGDFGAACLDLLQADWQDDPAAEALLGAVKGPALLLANHPFGAVESLWMLRLLSRARPDFKLMANQFLSAIPELQACLLPVDVLSSGPAARASNARSMRAAAAWLKAGHVVAAFPAGEVASLRWRSGRVEEPAWSGHLTRLALRSGASVLPLHFLGRNGAFFQAAGLLHPRLRTLLLAREAGRPRRRIRAVLGSALSPEDLRSMGPPEQLTEALREHTLSLEAPKHQQPQKRPAPLAIPPADEALRAEVAALLDQGRMLAAEGPFQVFWFLGRERPALMQALAVGRERSFRDAGEGTGRPEDRDAYDERYTQLLLWDREHQAVAGGYRAAIAREQWRQHGPQALYCSSLFDLDAPLRQTLAQALELGRSYIAGPWQRHPLALLLLWRALGAYALRIANCRSLFGCVSLSPSFGSVTQRLLLRFLTRYHGDDGSRGRARARHGIGRLLHGSAPEPADLRGLERWVRILEQGRLGVPPLVKHYALLGGKVLAFNRDPDFNDTIDALLLLDLDQAPERLLKRYLLPEDLRRLRESRG